AWSRSNSRPPGVQVPPGVKPRRKPGPYRAWLASWPEVGKSLITDVRASHGRPGGMVRRMRAGFPEGGNQVSSMSDRAITAARRAEAGKRQEPIRVLIADDHALFRRGLEVVLEEEYGCDLVGQASDGTE